MPVLLHSAALPCIHIGGVDLFACQQASRTALRCWQAIIFRAFRAGGFPVDEHCSSQILDLSYRPLPTIRRLSSRHHLYSSRHHEQHHHRHAITAQKRSGLNNSSRSSSRRNPYGTDGAAMIAEPSLRDYWYRAAASLSETGRVCLASLVVACSFKNNV